MILKDRRYHNSYESEFEENECHGNDRDSVETDVNSDKGNSTNIVNKDIVRKYSSKR